jgi:hypothetical protein
MRNLRPGRAGLLLAALGACGAPAPAPPSEALPARGPAGGTPDDRIVAFCDGKPLTWREVAEKALELDLARAVDQYLRWRLVEDRRQALGIEHTPEELRRRAEALARRLRETLEGGERAYRAELARRGLTEEDYIRRLAASRFLAHRLTLEKIVRYERLTEGTIEIDRLVFDREEEARRFAERCREAGFDQAAGKVGAGVPRLAEVFPATLPPGPPGAPPLDPGTVEAIRKLPPGEATGAVAGPGGLFYVIRLRAVRPGRAAPYAEARGEVFESLLSDPPAEDEGRRWMDREFARLRVEYASPGGP